jgi:hypothetical protein
VTFACSNGYWDGNGHGTAVASIAGGAIGDDVSGRAAFAEAAWGPGSRSAGQASELGVSDTLLGLAEGGRMGVVGVGLGPNLRLAGAWSVSDPAAPSALESDQRPSSRAGMISLNARITWRLTTGVGLGSLSEDNGLLGATYDGQGLLSLGERHQSHAVTASGALYLGGGRSLMAEALWATTDGSAIGAGLLRDVSRLGARAFGVSLVQEDALRAGDRLSLSFRKPLRVTSGEADLAVTSVDADGYPHTAFTAVSLVPNGDETDASLAYEARLGRGLNVSGGLDLKSDYRNIKGETDGGLRLGLDARF